MSIGAVSRGVLGLGSAADISDDVVFVPSKTFTFNAGIPTILDNDAIPIPSKTFTLTTTPPAISLGPLVQVPSKTFTLTTTPPAITESSTILIPGKVFTFTVTPPVISDGATILVPSKTFNFTANAPNIILVSRLLERTINTPCTDEAYLILLTIVHPDLTTDVNISNDPTQLLPVAQVRGTISNSTEFIYLPFEFILPNQEPDVSPKAQLRIDNVSREIGTILDSISSPPTINIQIVLSSTPDIIELELNDFRLDRTERNITTVMGELTVEHFDQEPFPVGRFNPSAFPGLFAN